MTAALLALGLAAAAAAEPAAHTLVVRHGAEVARLELVIEANSGSFASLEDKLLAGRTPPGDGSDPLDRLLDHAHLLRIEHRPAHPHAARATAALFAALDRNGDGTLDADELRTAERRLLARFDADGDGSLVPLEIVPDLLTAVPPTATPTAVAVEVYRPGESLPADARDLPAQRLTRRLTAAGVAVEFVSAPRWHDATIDTPRSLTKPAREADRRRFDAVAAAVATLTVRPEPRGWFERLDADGDGQISTRELRAAASVLGGVRLPSGPAVTVTLTPGLTARPVVPLTLTPAPPRGPAWFRALDRNADGDVSRAEFTGTAADFRRYDANGDGLISAAEADAGDRKAREEEKP